MKIPVSFKYPHFVEIATARGEVSRPDAEKFVCTWFGIKNLEQVASRMQSACQEVINIIRPYLPEKPGAEPYDFIRTRFFDEVIESAVPPDGQLLVKGWLLAPAVKLTTKESQQAFRRSRNSRIRAFAKVADIFHYENPEFRQLVEFLVETEIKRFSMMECYFPGFTLQNYHAEDVAKFEADFASLISWTRDSRSWSHYQQTIALDTKTDVLGAYQYLVALPHLVQMTILHCPGLHDYSSGHLRQIMEMAGKNIARYREEVAKVGICAANNSLEFRHTQFDIDRIKADYDSLQKWAEDWVGWTRSMAQEASKSGLCVLSRYAYLKNLPLDVAVTYLRGPRGACSAGYASYYFTEAEKQISSLLSEIKKPDANQPENKTEAVLV